ncbi:MAG TPA: acyl-CoA dehydrogenase family protein [Candidatus Limnocylindrales bacterium]|nr:acyl-CoA dehydrogenase family protein [Candidatus Limnocylindrales bacterium]
MNFELGPDERLLTEAVREALSRTDTLAAMRRALDGGEPIDLWKEAVRGEWTEIRDLLHAVLVLIECGRRLAPTGLVGHLTATIAILKDGKERAAYVPKGHHDFVPDAAEAEVLLVEFPDGLRLVKGAPVKRVGRYDPSRPLGSVEISGEGTRVDGDPRFAWNVMQTLLAAETLGAAEAALELAVAHAKQRKAFGRAIGSFQAIKHQLTDLLRLNENARSLLYFAAYAAQNEPQRFGLAANAARFAAEQAADAGTRRNIAVHGGLGVTWEHDAHLYFRRAQLSRLLLGGQTEAGERVVEHVLG